MSTDSIWGFMAWWTVKRLTRREIENMKKIMKTVPVVKAKNDIHHHKEEIEADKMFEEKIKEIENLK